LSFVEPRKHEVKEGDVVSLTANKPPHRPSLKRSLTTRTENIKKLVLTFYLTLYTYFESTYLMFSHITIGTAMFFGVPNDLDACMEKWNNRRMRHCSRRYGAVKETTPLHFVEVLNLLIDL